jgi:uncharacterized cupin superfamily protein
VSKSIVIANVSATELQQAPIKQSSILSGTPEARNRLLVRSSDKLAHILVWECSPGTFYWHYDEAETAVIISGETILTFENGRERRVGPGDMVYFPAGCSCHWRITSKIRKVAIMHRFLPPSLALGLQICNKLLRIVRSAMRWIRLNSTSAYAVDVPHTKIKKASAR